MARHAEWRLQTEVARLCELWLADDVFWSGIDTVPRSAVNGFMRRLRGCRSGMPDFVILSRGKLIGIELKTPGGQVRPAQRLVREQLLRAGGRWWVCCSASAVMWVLTRERVRLRTLTNNDGSTECWRQPPLEDWERPKTDPRERRPRPPSYWAPKVAVETETSEPAAARDDEDADIAA